MTTNQLPKNPFALLRISTEATRQEVVERGKELIEDTKDQDLPQIYRKAIEQIINHPFNRMVQAAWEMPNTDYEDHDEKWQKLVKAFQSSPIDSNKLGQIANAFAEENFEPDRLLELLSPLLEVTRPTETHAFALGAAPADNLHQPLDNSELL